MDQFKIGPKLGRGPAGSSYAGALAADGRPVVVKVLTSRFSQHPDLLEEVLDALKGWQSFRHPNAAAPLSVGVHRGRHVVLYDRIDGSPLERRLADGGPLDARQASRVVRDLALALAATHRADVPVGDVRSAKVYFDGERTRLADLGQARASCLTAGYGALGLAFGHPAYLAPEVPQERATRPTKAGDVYALGILFYELLTGSVPFPGEARQQLHDHLEKPLPPPPPAIAGNEALRKMLARMTAKDPARRYPDAQAVLEALYAMVGQRPPEQEHASVDPALWRTRADEDARERSSEWSRDRVEKARPVGPALAAQRHATGRLPRQATQGGEETMSLPASASQAASSSPPVGSVRIGAKIARGPVGTTYEGELAHYSGSVVVKVLSQKFAKHEELHQRILERLQGVVGLAGPHLVGAFRLMRVTGRDVLVSERCGGRTLRAVLSERRTLPVEEALAHLRELANALAAGRRRGVSHGDIRPEKVFIDDAGRARLADFGLAEASCLGAQYGQIGLRFGHPAYSAPEVVQEEQREPEPPGDVYALGVLAYEMLCGVRPFAGETPRETLVMHFESPLPPPPKSVHVPEVVAELLMRLTAKDPHRRPQDPAALASEIARCEKQVELAASSCVEEVDEFDPTAMGETGQAADLWKSTEAELTSEPAGDWRKSRVQQAPQVGPEGWEPGEGLYQSEELDRESPLDLP